MTNPTKDGGARKIKYVNGCADCAKQVERWIVITESATSSHVARYHTEAAARSFYVSLENHIGTPFCMSRTLVKVLEYEKSERFDGRL